jgi:hypothetical protein
MPYFAEFSHSGKHLVRLDTRFYFSGNSPSRRTGDCLGSIIMCNPGGATGPLGIWTRIINTDPTLNAIDQILRAAVALKRDRVPAFSVSPDAYVQILNCCYICNTTPPISCLCGIAEPVKGKWIWVAWGDKSSAIITNGIGTVGMTPAFWFEQSCKGIQSGTPSLTNFPIHPLPMGWRKHYPNYPNAIAVEIAGRL